MKTSHWPVSILSGAASLISFMIPVAMSRILSAEEIGDFRIFFLYLGMMPALSLTMGLWTALYYWAGRGERGAGCIRAAWRLLLVGSVICPLVCLVALLTVPALRSVIGEGNGREMAFLFALALPSVILGFFYEHASVALGRVWWGGAFAGGFELLRTGAMVATLLCGGHLREIVIAHVVVGWLKVFVGVWLTFRQKLLSPEAYPGVRTDVRGAVDVAFPMSLSAVLDQVVASSDRLILSGLLVPARYAVYSMGCLVISPFLILEQSVNRVLIPKMSRLLEEGQAPVAARSHRDAIEELLLFHIPATAGLAVFARPVVEILYSAKFMDAAQYLRVYAIWYTLMAVPDDTTARAMGESKWIVRNNFVMGALALGGSFAGAKFWGAMGALGAFLLVSFTQKAYALFWSSRKLRVSLADLFPVRRAGEFAALAAALAVVCLATHPLFRSDIRWFLACAPGFAAIYLAICFKNASVHSPSRVLGAYRALLKRVKLLYRPGRSRS